MSNWTPEDLERIGDSTELRVSSLRKNGTLRPYVTIWVVRAGDDIYIRSAYGADNPWYVRAKAIGEAYHAKYDRYGQAIVRTVVGPDVAPPTLRLLPRG